MEKDSESWLHHRPLDEQFPNAEFSKLPLNNLGMQNSRFPGGITCTGGLPTFTLLSYPNIKPGELNEPHGWFYGGPGSGQGLVPDIMFHDSFMSNTNLPATKAGSGPASKQFLVFDQTGNKTTMMFSSGIGSSIPQATAWTCKPSSYYDFNENERHYSGLNLADDLDDGHGSVVGSDMREDSEEINALLYSDEDDDNYSDDGEETSTGHSPSTMTSFEKHDWLVEEDMDEVASSVGLVKKRKFSESDDHEVLTVTHTLSHVKPNGSLEHEEDAESSCVGTTLMPFDDIGSLSGNKRTRREKIRETVSVLETILPCGKGKDAVMVLDEAINYLRTLKYKALSLGLSGSSE